MKRPRPKSAAAKATDSWICPTCNSRLSARFCPGCGESPLLPHDLTLRGFFGQVVLACTSIDGPILRSLRCLVTRPGFLTVAYLTGQRKPYTLPLQLFLLANVLFFAMQALVGAKIFSTPLDMHLNNQFWSSVAQPLVTHRLETIHTTLDLYSPVFNRAVELNAKSLIILMVLPFAVFLPLIFYGKRIPFVGHIVFSLHFYTFLLLLFCVALTVVGASLLTGGAGLNSESFDHILSAVDVTIAGAYLFVAAGTVYKERGAFRVFKTLLLVTATVGIVLGYRFALLLITLYTA